MSRLIDADKLLEELRENHPLSLSYGILSDIEYFPTAYDVDRVLKQLSDLDVGTMFCSECKYAEECEAIADEMLEKHKLDDRVDLCAMLMKTKAIEIVKKRGTE